MTLAGSLALLPAAFIEDVTDSGIGSFPTSASRAPAASSVLPLRLAPRHLGDYFLLDEAWWLTLHTYAATAEAWSGVSCAPPMGGIGLR